MRSAMIVFRRGLGFAILLSLLLSTSAFAQKAHKTDTEVSPDETAKFEAAVRSMINRSGQGLTVYKLQNGVQVVDLQGRFQSVALAKKDNQGTLSTSCVSTEKEVDHFLKGEATKPAKAAGKRLARKSAPAAEVK